MIPEIHFTSNLQFLGNVNFLQEEICPGIPATRKQQLWNGESLPDAGELLIIAAQYGITIDRLLKKNLAAAKKPAKQLKLVVFDVDGVLTDGGMYYTESGDEFKKFNSKDGLAIRRLAKEGFVTGIISHGINKNLIERRATLLDISKVYAGTRPKAEVLTEWCNELGIIPEETAYIGDDINDLPVMRMAGFTACPADAVDAVKNEVDVVLKKKGGEGCVREWIDGLVNCEFG